MILRPSDGCSRAGAGPVLRRTGIWRVGGGLLLVLLIGACSWFALGMPDGGGCTAGAGFTVGLVGLRGVAGGPAGLRR